MTEHKPIPFGWRFYTADFSVEGENGRAMLTRETHGERGKTWWHSLDEAGRENTALYITGFGETVNEAISDAIKYIPNEYRGKPDDKMMACATSCARS